MSIAHGPRVLHLRLLASYYYLDRGYVPGAIKELTLAEAIYEESASEIPVEWHLSAGLGHGIDEEGLRQGGEFLARRFRVKR